MRGRPRKSEGQHKFEGTFKPSEHAGINVPPSTGHPKKPRGMSKDEGWLWDLIVQEWMGAVDAAQLREICEAWGLYRAAYKAAKADPIDRDARIAYCQYSATFDRLASRFGLNPSDRARIRVPAEPQGDDDERFFGVAG